MLPLPWQRNCRDLTDQESLKVHDTAHELWNAVMDMVWLPAVFHQRRNLRPPKLVLCKTADGSILQPQVCSAGTPRLRQRSRVVHTLRRIMKVLVATNIRAAAS